MTKDVVKHYRMTTEDARVFHEKAEQAGMTEAEYFRLLIIGRLSIAIPQYRGAAIQLCPRAVFPVDGMVSAGLSNTETKASDGYP